LIDYVFEFFFFFQAEDGIRDLTVTGVQTCALPISQVKVISGIDYDLWGLRICPDLDTVMYTLVGLANKETGWGVTDESFAALARSEERRVGKECRYRWWREREKESYERWRGGDQSV